MQGDVEPGVPQASNVGAGPKIRSGVNVQELMDRVGGDRDLLRDLCAMFIAELPGMLGTLRQAVESGDYTAVSRSAHGLKGSIGVFGKGTAYELALALEMAAREGRMENIRPSFQSLVASLEELKSELADLILLSRGPA